MRGNNKSDLKRFLIYSVYAWGSTICMVVLCYLLDASSIPTKFQPGMGFGTCFLKKTRLSEFLYLYLPIILIMTCNSTFFILTALKIRKVQMETSKDQDSKRHQKHLDNDKAQFVLFFRLLGLMGVTWSMEAISWLISPDGWYFFITDLMNAIQGVVIFFMFVMKRKVREFVMKRWNIWLGKTPQRNRSKGSTTQTTNIEMNTNKRS